MCDRIYVSQPTLDGNERLYVNDCLNRNHLTQGKYVAEFEALFAQTCGVRYGVATMNGTTALHLLLESMHLRPGDEVIVPNLTFVATANAVRMCGATPVFADVDPFHWTLDLESAAAHITSRTRGIIAVHLYGHPADMDRINMLAQANGLWVVEDAAEAIGATYKGRPVGALADAAIFSFYGNKTITCGEGGMVVTNREDLMQRMYLLRGQAQSPTVRYYHTELGYNYRMTDLQAAIGLAQVEQLTQHLACRELVWREYDRHLSHNAIFRSFGRQYTAMWAKHGYWMRVITFSGPDTCRVVTELLERDGIETRPIFVPMSRLPMYQQIRDERYPISEKLAICGLCLPTHEGLTPALIDRIVTRVCYHAERVEAA